MILSDLSQFGLRRSVCRVRGAAGDGFSGNVELDVVGEEVEVETMTAFDATKTVEERTKHTDPWRTPRDMLMNCFLSGR